MDKKAFVIDGHSLLYRIYYATLNQLAYYKSKDLEPVNVLKTFLLMLLKLKKENNYTHGLVAFDLDKKSLQRTLDYEDYKSQRKPMPSELKSQIPLIIDAIKNVLNINVIQILGAEADDIIASFAKLSSANNINCDIYTSDHDMLQLVNKYINVCLFKVGISNIDTITNDNFFEKLNIFPEQVIFLKAITGDTSDNIKGIVGIGEKTAIKLLNEYKTIDNIYENLDKLSTKQQELFKNGKDCIAKNINLVQLRTNFLDNYNINDFIVKENNLIELKKIIDKYHFSNVEKYLTNTD